MKHAACKKRTLVPLLLLSTLNPITLNGTSCTCAVTPFLTTRSTSEHSERIRAGWANQTYLADVDQPYGSMSITPAYSHSYNADAIAKKLFGCDLSGCNAITLRGSEASPNGTTDWLADWFYLGDEYAGSFCVDPYTQNTLVDLTFYWGMDDLLPGLYVQLDAPIVWTKWDLQFGMNRETGTSSSNALLGETALTSFSDFACHQQTTNSSAPENTTLYPLCSSRICPCTDTHTYLSDVSINLGWNFLLDDRYHCGVFARGSVPTGNTPKGIYLFEPIVGSGHHWQLGGGLSAHALLWYNKEKEDHHIGVYVDGNVTHLFNATQCRFFDLKDKPWSRYILAAKKVDNTTYYSPVANLTAHEVKVRADVQTDITALFNYTNGGFTLDLGYNLWAKTCDKFDSCCDAYCCGGKRCDCSSSTCPFFYCELDGETWYLLDKNDTIHAHNSSSPTPKYLTADTDLDIDGARTKSLTHTAFAHIAYSWYAENYHAPYLGLGGSVEFGPRANNYGATTSTCSTDCCSDYSDNCMNSALSQWSIWLKGGISF